MKANETLHAAIRYDEHMRPLAEVIRSTYFDGVDLVPGNLELMEFEIATPMALRSGNAGDPAKERGDLQRRRISARGDQKGRGGQILRRTHADGAVEGEVSAAEVG